VNNKGIPPGAVLAITFTKKAACEMRERLEQIMGCAKPLPFVGTFHGFCFEILKNYKGVPLTILDDKDRFALFLDAIKQVEKNGEAVDENPLIVLDWIIFAKQNIIGPQDHTTHVPESKIPLFRAIYTTYQNLMSISGSCDFEDLIFETVRLFETDKAFIEKIRDRLRFVFVDEYQDLNHGQYRMITAMVPPNKPPGDICVIGDPDQAIYGFRGSDAKYFNGFIEDYPGATVVNLIRNYRSTQTILNASQQAINKPDKEAVRIFSKIDGTKSIHVLEATSEKAEAVAVGKVIEDLMGGVGFHSINFNKIDNSNTVIHRSFSDFAVLFRTTDQTRIFSKTFDAAGIPHQVVSRKRIFDEKGAKTLISMLKIVEGLGCSIDFSRIMRWQGSGFNEQEIDRFKGWCYNQNIALSSALFYAKRFPIKDLTKQTQRKLAALIDTIANIKAAIQDLTIEKKLDYIRENTTFFKTKSGDETTKEAMNHLFDMAKTVNSDLSGFLSQISLKTDTDIHIPQAERVALMTIHAAKGLEFPIVFISGCEDGYLPFTPFDKKRGDIDEEKRLFYVAMTRARERVYLTYAKKRQIYGKTQTREISPFVANIEEGLKLNKKLIYAKKKKQESKQLRLF
jgi:superfamily I DNA/RNA helicase